MDTPRFVFDPAQKGPVQQPDELFILFTKFARDLSASSGSLKAANN